MIEGDRYRRGERYRKREREIEGEI